MEEILSLLRGSNGLWNIVSCYGTIYYFADCCDFFNFTEIKRRNKLCTSFWIFLSRRRRSFSPQQ